MNKVKQLVCMGLLSLLVVMFNGCSRNKWHWQLQSELFAFGHRNWIVIADSAYPQQSAAGIKTYYTNASQLEVLDHVLTEIDNAPHIQPVILLDAELEYVSEADAPGIELYRTELNQMLKGKQIMRMPHDQIITKLDEVSKLFDVLILKTDMILPYTSVFIQLECGYWNPEKEKRLRNSIMIKK